MTENPSKTVSDDDVSILRMYYNLNDLNSKNIIYRVLQIAPDAYLALEDFFTIFPDMKAKVHHNIINVMLDTLHHGTHSQEFYTSGESYCGVYLPLITSYLAEKIDVRIFTAI